MGQFLMSTITTIGGVGGVLIGVLFVGIVIAVGLIPLVLINRKNELTEDSGDTDEHLKRVRDRMSVHV